MRAAVFIALISISWFTRCQDVITYKDALNSLLKNNPDSNDSLNRNLTLELKKNWYNWLYSINRELILQDFLNSVEELERIARLRYQSGDIDFIESASLINTIAEITVNLAVCENQTLQYENTLRQLMYYPENINPSDTLLDLYVVDKSREFEKGMFEPDTINSYDSFIHDLQLRNLQIELDNLFIKLQYYRSFAIDYSNGILTTAQAKLTSEDIDYIEYSGLMTKAFRIRLDYLDALNQYNQCAIQLEHYAY